MLVHHAEWQPGTREASQGLESIVTSTPLNWSFLVPTGTSQQFFTLALLITTKAWDASDLQ